MADERNLHHSAYRHPDASHLMIEPSLMRIMRLPSASVNTFSIPRGPAYAGAATKATCIPSVATDKVVATAMLRSMFLKEILRYWVGADCFGSVTFRRI